MSYEIKPRQRTAAKKIGVTIKPSTNSKKKLDVYSKKNDKKIASIGETGYKDYATYIKEKGKEYADERRDLYYKRHGKATSKDSAKYFSHKYLW